MTVDEQVASAGPAVAPRVPPQSAETEAAVLSAWLISERFAKAWPPELDLFAVPAHRALASTLAHMDPAVRDDTAVLTRLALDGNAEAVGYTEGLFRIRNCAPGWDDPWPHVATLRKLAALRRLLGGLERAAATGYLTSDLDEVIAQASDALKGATVQTGARVLSVADMFTAIATRVLDRTTSRRCPSGVPSFDRHTGGFRAPHVAVMGAATNWGKSSFAIMVADETLAVGMRPLIVSFEDDEDLYGRRLLARRTKANATRIRDMSVTDEEMQDIIAAAKSAERSPFFLDARGRSVEQVSSDIRSLCASEEIDLVIGDYLQAAQSSRRTQDRRNEITHIARTLTDAIKSSQKAGLLFSQIKRMEPGDRPTKHDLKESGDVENAAEMVIMGYLSNKGAPLMIVDKCKDGMKGIEYPLAWHGEACCFLGEVTSHAPGWT